MILQALKEYYDRKAADPDAQTAPEGFERKGIPFIVVIKPDGEFVNIEDTREKQGRRLVSREFLLPRSIGRSGQKAYEITFLLWDHIGYLFGHPERDKKAINQHNAWLHSIRNLDEKLKQDRGVSAVINFYKKGEYDKVKKHIAWKDCVRPPSCNMTFRLIEDPPDMPVPCRPIVQEYVKSLINRDDNNDKSVDADIVLGNCLVTGEHGEIARKFSDTPISKDSKKFVSFQKNSGYDSFGKEQGYNAPISVEAEFACVTGLNMLLKSKCQRIQVADATAVFWAAKKSVLERDAFFFFSEPRKDDPGQGTLAIQSLYASIWNGTYIVPPEDSRFYVLGLTPSKARISVRFWQVGTVKEIGQRLKQHVDDLAICHDSKNQALPIKCLLASIAPQGDEDHIPPKISGDMMRAILGGTPYPQTLLSASVRRIRAEQAKKDKKGRALPNVTYERAALLKACINRELRYNKITGERELTVSLDESNSNIGYRLGRLFAALEKVQQEANPGINATIRDRFYGAASGTPVAVFANLMRLKNHHLAKLERPGRRIQFEKLISQIMDGVADFPPHLSLADQGRFAIGYYHQMQHFFTKKVQPTEEYQQERKTVS